MRAVSDVNVQLTKATGKQIAKQLEVTEEFAVAAMNKHASRIVGKQANVQKVVRHAVEQLKLEAPKTVDSAHGAQEPPVADISEDWLNVFEQEAMNMSSDAMQRHFGRILAGEIRKPASFSIKTIKIMAQLDNRAASVFTNLCSLSISLRFSAPNGVHEARVVSMGQAASNSLSPFDLSFDNLNILQEYGLIISDYNSHNDYRASIKQDGFAGFPFVHQGRIWVFVPKSHIAHGASFQVSGVAMTASGRELLPIVEVFEQPDYLFKMKAFFDLQGYVMQEVPPVIFQHVVG